MNSAPASAILAASFGTTYEEALEKSIGGIERALERAFPHCPVRRAFTSGMVIRSLRRRGMAVDTVQEALEKLAGEGVREVVLQPTHIMPGHEYDLLVKAASAYTDRFEALKLAAPLLFGQEDYDAVADILIRTAAAYSEPGTALVLMGHGTDHQANAGYARLQQRLWDRGGSHIFVGTVEGTPTVKDVQALVSRGGYRRVVLQPLMIVAGDHAHRDMAGGAADSWKSLFEAGGLKTRCVLRGLGESEAIQGLFVRHAAEAMA